MEVMQYWHVYEYIFNPHVKINSCLMITQDESSDKFTM